MSSHFRVTYDGPALAASTMGVRALAPALLALGDALDAANPAEDLLLDDVRKIVFSIVSPDFRRGSRWRLYDGAATKRVTVSDVAFLARVDSNQELFAKGDVLICMVRVRQWQTVSGARTEYDVTEVLEHRQAAMQLRLPT